MDTYCEWPFLQKLARAKRDREEWKAHIETLPEVCPKGCAVGSCREVGRRVANDQWKLGGGR